MLRKPLFTRVIAVLTIALLCHIHRAAADSGVLHIYNWTDYTAPDLIKKFTRETGVRVTIDIYDSNETLLAKLSAGTTGYDVIVASSDFVPILVKQHLIQSVDVAGMSNFKNLASKWQKRDWDPEARYTVPWQWGTTSFVYDSKIYPGKVDSLETLYNPPAVFRGQIGMFGSVGEVISMALVYLGKPQCNEDPATLKAVLALLEAQKPFVKVYNSDGVLDRVTSGETTMSMEWSGSAARVRAAKPSIRYVYPKEGVIGWMDNLAVPVGAPDFENAKKFLDFMMDPQNAALETNFAGYQNAVPQADEYVNASIRNAAEYNTPQNARLSFTPTCEAKATRDYDRIWTILRQ